MLQGGRAVTTDVATAPQLLYKVSDLVTVLRMSRAYIYKQIKAGHLNTVKEGDSTFITADDLADYIALLKHEAAERNGQ